MDLVIFILILIFVGGFPAVWCRRREQKALDALDAPDKWVERGWNLRPRSAKDRGYVECPSCRGEGCPDCRKPVEGSRYGPCLRCSPEQNCWTCKHLDARIAKGRPGKEL